MGERQNGSYLLLSFPKLFYPEDKNLGKIKKKEEKPQQLELMLCRG